MRGDRGPLIVGTPVHFYSTDERDQFGTQGIGPYAAIVLEVGSGSCALRVMCFGHTNDYQDVKYGREVSPVRWWEYPS